MKNLKDKISNIAGLLILVATAVQQTLSVQAGNDINWLTIAVAVGGAVVAWLTGKKADGKAA